MRFARHPISFSVDSLRRARPTHYETDPLRETNVTKPSLLNGLKVLLVLISFLMLTEMVKAQEIFEAGRSDLNATERGVTAGKITWSLINSGTRTAGVTCTPIAFSSNEIIFRVKDTGGLAGDAACDLNLSFGGLQNFYTFSHVRLETFQCGNAPCANLVIRPGTPGRRGFFVTVRGKMTGVVPFVTHSSFFKVRLTLRGPAAFSPFIHQAKPYLVVSGISKERSIGDPVCNVGVTLSNLGEANWQEVQSHAYDPDGEHAVTVTLEKNRQTCGFQRVTLNDFDPGRVLNDAASTVTLRWPQCSFSGSTSTRFDATVDAGERLVERVETGKSATVHLTCLPSANRPRPALDRSRSRQ